MAALKFCQRVQCAWDEGEQCHGAKCAMERKRTRRDEARQDETERNTHARMCCLWTLERLSVRVWQRLAARAVFLLDFSAARLCMRLFSPDRSCWRVHTCKLSLASPRLFCAPLEACGGFVGRLPACLVAYACWRARYSCRCWRCWSTDASESAQLVVCRAGSPKRPSGSWV